MSNLSFVKHVGDGVTNTFLLAVGGDNIGYLDTRDIYVYVDGVEVTFSIQPASPHLAILDEAPADGSDVLIRRQVSKTDTYSDFSRGNVFSQKNMNNSFLQTLYLSQEWLDGFLPEGSYQKQDMDFGSKFAPTNLRAPVVPSDAVTKEYADVISDRVTEIENTVISGDTRFLSYTYKNGSADGGEIFFSVPYAFQSINRVYINGSNQTYGLAWDFDVDTQLIELAEGLEAGDEVVIEIGFEPEKVLDNEIVSGASEIVATGTTTPRTLADWVEKEILSYNTVVGAKADLKLEVGRRVKTCGYSFIGDGGGAEYVVVAGGTGTDDGGLYHDIDNGNQLQLVIKDNTINIRQFGANGSNDDTLAVHAFLDAGASLAPIKLYAPAGTYIVDSIAGRPDPLTIPSGVTFVGDGRGVTEFKFKGGETHTGTLLHLTNVSDVEVSGMTINGNSVGSHAIRMATCINIKLTDIVSLNSNGYGIGMQQGYIRNVWLRSLWIINSYGDGIDIKDKDFSNSNINLEDITVSNFNVGLQSNKAALDLRSPCRVSGVYIEDFGQAGVTMDGLRLRPGEEPEANGRGAHTSQVDNVRVIPDKGSKVANTRGVVIEGRECQLSNIYVQGCQQGILNYQSGSCVSGFNIANCNEGLFCVGATGYPSDGDRSSFSTGSITSCSSRAVVIESDYCNFNSVTLRSNEGGYQINATANNTRIIGGSITNTGSGGSLLNNGSNTRVVACAGLSDI